MDIQTDYPGLYPFQSLRVCKLLTSRTRREIPWEKYPRNEMMREVIFYEP